MKRLLIGALASLFAIVASATTLNPIQLLNPAGSTSGQSIVSTGPSTVPGWSSTYGPSTFTGDLTVSEPSAALIMNDTSGTGFPQFVYRSSGVNKWIVFDAPSTHLFTVNRYVGGTFQDTPMTISNSSGVVTMLDGITGTPISGSTGSFTTLAASSTVSGTGFSTYLASPPAIGTTTPAAGKFTTLQATSTITPSSTAGIVGTTTNDNANAGSVGEYATNTTTGTSVTTLVPFNATSISLPAGDWDVTGVIKWNPAGSTIIAQTVTGINTTSATIGATGTFASSPAVANSAGSGYASVAPVVRISLASATTVFLVGNANFSTSTLTADGFIRVRRVR